MCRSQPPPTPSIKPSTNDIAIRPMPWDHPDCIHLRALLRTEMISLAGKDPGTPPTAANIAMFLVVHCDSVPVGCGGLRPLLSPPCPHSAAVEVKRMFVEPAHRGSNVNIGLEGTTRQSSIADLLLRRLEEEARARGWQVLLLETGTFMNKARRFYERWGFIRCGFYGNCMDADDSVYYEKRIVGISM